MLYLYTNIYRGGEGSNSTNISLIFFINLALWYPAFSITLRLRSVLRAIAIKQEKKYSTRKALEKVSNSNTTKQSIQYYLELITGIITIIVGVVVGLLILIRFFVMYNKCADEFTVQLWEASYPRKMFANGLFNPNCGYDRIERISANGSNVAVIPDIVSKCTKLQVLHVSNNSIKSLPCSLLVNMPTIHEASLDGNPVSKVLNIKDCKLNTVTFPTSSKHDFICSYMYKNLEVLTFPNQTVKKVDKCIGKLSKLKTLSLPYNQLQEDGLPYTILKLKNLTTFNVFGNEIILESFSFRNENIPIELHGDMQRFIFNYFKDVKYLDLSGNNIQRDEMFHELLQNLTELHVLNMSYNEMTNVLPPLNVDPTSWPNLEVIDLSSNPLTFVALTFAQAVEIRHIKVFYENVKTLTTLNWRYGEGGKNKQDSKLYDKDRKSIFPASMFKQMRHGNLKILFMYKYDVLITDESLDTLCKIGSLKYLYLSSLKFNVLNIPYNCRNNISFFEITKRENDESSSTVCFSWPEFFLNQFDIVSFEFKS